MQPKRDTNDVLSAIGRAMRLGGGQLLENVDPVEVAADADARDRVTIRLRGYDSRGLIGANDIAEAERKYRVAIERLLGGPRPLCEALSAAEAAREQPLEELSSADQALLRKWSGAAVQLRAEGLETCRRSRPARRGSTSSWYGGGMIGLPRRGSWRLAPPTLPAAPDQRVLFLQHSHCFSVDSSTYKRQLPMTLPQIYRRSAQPDVDNPFAGDLFNLRALATRLETFIDRLPEGGVFAIDAPWGEGKSWFGRNWHADLRSKKFTTVYIDSFAQDYLDDPFQMLFSEISAELKKKDETQGTKIARSGGRLALTLLPAAAKILVNAGGKLIGTSDIVGEFSEAIDDARGGAADAVEKVLKLKIESYEADKLAVASFQRALSEYAAGKSKPTIIFIDELDRCRPPFAVRTIERIKHFFDIPGFVFVLLLNKQQICESVRGVYGQGIDAETYLGKFIQFSLTLPKKHASAGSYDSYNARYLMDVLTRYGFPFSNATQDFCTQIGIISSFIKLSFRDIERVAVLYSLVQPMSANSFFAAWPIVLKIAKPDLFRTILDGSTTAHKSAADLLSQNGADHRDNAGVELFLNLHRAHTDRSAIPVDVAARAQNLGVRDVQNFVHYIFSKVDLNVD